VHQNRCLNGLNAAFGYLEGLDAPMSAGSLTPIDCPQQFAGGCHQGLRERASDWL